ncbi:MAG TPA: hypothetical protein VL262_00540 [Vicinamibacterales bacterium]|nr:hypothetical protein [Vicinamibacterales bacterium]
MQVSEAFRTVLVAFGALAAGFTWLSARTASIPTASPQRLVAELRLAQIAALLLTLIAGAYVGLAVVRENEPGVGLDIALAVGFMVVAAWTMMRDPRQALTMLALAFAAHALVDIAHRPGLLPDALAPRWYAIGCAIYDAYIGALCYFPLLRR